MAGLWFVFSIMTYFMFFNLSAELKDMRRAQRRANLGTPAVTVQADNSRPVQRNTLKLNAKFCTHPLLDYFHMHISILYAQFLLELNRNHQKVRIVILTLRTLAPLAIS